MRIPDISVLRKFVAYRIGVRAMFPQHNNICIGPVNCWRTHKSNTKGITLALRNSGSFPRFGKVIPHTEFAKQGLFRIALTLGYPIYDPAAAASDVITFYELIYKRLFADHNMSSGRLQSNLYLLTLKVHYNFSNFRIFTGNYIPFCMNIVHVIKKPLGNDFEI